jgi:hypothetical protein
MLLDLRCAKLAEAAMGVPGQAPGMRCMHAHGFALGNKQAAMAFDCQAPGFSAC